MLRRFISLIPLLAVGIFATFPLSAAEPHNPALERQFTETVSPFVTQYCAVCHGGETPASHFNIAVYSTFQTVVEDHPHWALILGRLKAGEMPPQGVPQPPQFISSMAVLASQPSAGSEVQCASGAAHETAQVPVAQSPTPLGGSQGASQAPQCSTVVRSSSHPVSPSPSQSS
jgi:hypothetical protein